MTWKTVWTRTAALAVALGASSVAAQPAVIPVQGFLTDSGGVALDAPSLAATIRLYTVPTAGSPFYTEATTLAVDEGRFVHYLGSTTALNLTSFTGAEVYIGVSVAGGAELTPRIRMGTTAYAAYAGRVPWSGITGVPASIADGDQNTTYTAASPLSLNLGTNTFGLSNVGCNDGDAWIWNAGSSSWVCEPAGTGGGLYAAGAGLALTGTTFAVSAPTCAVGQYSRWNGSAWLCAADQTGLTSLAGGDGISVLGNEIFISSPACLADEYSRWNGLEWECVQDLSEGLAAGNGIAVAGGAISISSATCTAGQYSRWNGTAWVCATDAVGLTSLTAGNGVAVAGSTISVLAPTCATGEYSAWNGTAWTCVADNSEVPGAGAGLEVDGDGDLAVLSPTCSAGQVSRWNGTEWTCVTDAGLTALVAGNGIGVSGATISVAAPTCAGGQYSSWNGSAWTCVADISSTYTASNGLASTGTAFRIDSPACVSGQVSFWNGTAWSCVSDNAGVTSVASGLGITVTGTTTPSVAVNSPVCLPTEYSRWTAGGWACVSDVSSALVGGNGITVSGGAISINSVACTAGQYSRFDGTSWTCQADAGITSLTAGNGVTTTGSTIGINAPTCLANEYLYWSGSAFLCRADVSSTLSAGNGVTINGSNQITINAAACQSGSFLQWTGTAWGCAADQVGFTALTGGNGITTSGQTISVSAGAACGANQYLNWNGTGFVCKTDTSAALTAGNGLTLTGSNQFAINSPGCTAGQVSQWTGTAWACVADAGITSISGGTGITTTGTSIAINATACGTNEYSKWTAGGWTCVADVSNTYTNGTGLTLTGTTFGISSSVCTGTQYSRWTAGGWTCANDEAGVTSVTGTAPVVVNNTNPAAPVISLAVSGCAANQFMRWTGAAWTCADALTGVTASAASGITVTGTGSSRALELTGLTTCASGSFQRWTGSAWTCEVAPGITTINQGAGITVSGSGATRSIAANVPGAACGVNQAVTWNGSSWVCTSITAAAPVAGTGIAVTGTTISINATQCADLQHSRWTASGWVCEDTLPATLAAQVRANNQLHGGGTITFDGSSQLSWNSRFIAISGGRGSFFSTTGYFDIETPGVGTIIPGVGGSGNVTVTAGGVAIPAWHALYYILPVGSSQGSLAANFRMAHYTVDTVMPPSWVLIAVRNGDNGALYVNGAGGVTMLPGQTFTSTAVRPPDTNNFQARLTGSCPAGQSIRAIDASGNVTCETLATTIHTLRAGTNITGGGTFFWRNNRLRWTDRAIIISQGQGAEFSTDGHFNIGNIGTGGPTSGTITGWNRGNVTANGDGIPLECWEGLFYELPIGSSSPFQVGNLRVGGYNNAGLVPNNWVTVAIRNCDTFSSSLYVNINGGMVLHDGETNYRQDLTGGVYALSSSLGISPDDRNDAAYVNCRTSINWVDRNASSVRGPYNIGFNFTFGGREYSQVRVSSEGVLCFGGSETCSSGFDNNPLPRADFDSAIFVYWDNLIPWNNDNMGNGCVGTNGTAPGRVFTWWQMWDVAANSSDIETIVMLHEGSDTVTVRYHEVQPGATGIGATIGYQVGLNGTGGFRQLVYNSQVLDDNEDRRHSWSLTPVDTRPR